MQISKWGALPPSEEVWRSQQEVYHGGNHKEHVLEDAKRLLKIDCWP